MRKTLIALFLALISLLGIQPAIAGACSGYWFESQRTGRLELVNFTQELHCIWGTAADKNALQRSGECGLPKQKNDLIAITHNWYCSSLYCPVGSVYQDETNIPRLKPGERVQLCDGATLWNGRVIATILDAKERGIQPQTEFRCAGEKCGAIVTSWGERQGYYGPANYAVVRISYTSYTRAR